MSAAPIKPTEIVCKDGRRFLVTGRPGSVVVFATFRDSARVQCGLAKFETFHEPGDLRAEHEGMPVEIVRAYAKAHGGVAQAGEEALALLKSLPSTADPPMGAPATDSRAPAAEEAAPSAPLPDARGASLAGRAPAPAAPRALGERGVAPAPRIQLDELTPAIMAARRVIASGNRVGLDRTLAATALVVVTDDRYERHPLLSEGVRLRELLSQRVTDSRPIV